MRVNESCEFDINQRYKPMGRDKTRKRNCGNGKEDKTRNCENGKEDRKEIKYGKGDKTRKRG